MMTNILEKMLRRKPPAEQEQTEDFSVRVRATVAPLVKNRADLQRALRRAEKNLETEKSRLEGLQRHRANLLVGGKTALAGPHYEKAYRGFGLSISKCDQEMGTKQEGIRILEQEIIPALRHQLAEAETALERALTAEYRAEFQKTEPAAMEQVKAALGLFADLFDRCDTISRECGWSFSPRHSLRPLKFLAQLHTIHSDFAKVLKQEREARAQQPEAAGHVPSEETREPEPEMEVEPEPEAEAEDIPVEVLSDEGPAAEKGPMPPKTLLTGIIKMEDHDNG